LIDRQRKILSRVVDDIPDEKIRYNRLLLPNRGVVDDILVYKSYEQYLMVLNASNADKDMAFMKANGVETSYMGLHIIALQGPKAEEILQEHTDDDLKQISYYGFIPAEIHDVDAIISRTGYTGEKGFEIMVTPADMPKVWNMFLTAGVLPCGLGARDTLRIEAGMPLYGHEMKDEWTTDQSDTITGIKMLEKGGVPRQGYRIFNAAGKDIGEVTSGTFSPTLQEPIAMVMIGSQEPGTPVFVEIRGRQVKATVVDIPFVSNVRKK
jgi:aminomethyltransferase